MTLLLNNTIHYATTPIDLRGTDSNDRWMCLVQGGTTVNDGNWTFYIYDASSTATDNGTTVIKPNVITNPANPGRWVLFNGTFNLSNKPAPTLTINSVTRALNTAFQISTTKDAIGLYTVRATPVLSLTTGQSSLVKFSTGTSSGGPFTDATSQEGGIQGTLVVGLNITNANGGTLGGAVLKNNWAILQSTGTATATYVSGQEILFG